MRNLEQELKLKLDQREYEVLSKLTDNVPQLQTNYYFKSAHLPDETMVRVREKNGQYTLCYKNRLMHDGGVSVCDERECELSEGFAQSFLRRGIMPGEINIMLKTELHEAMLVVGQLKTYRTQFTLMEWTLELDKSIYFDNCDYELECECNNIESLEKLKNFLSYNYGIVIKYSTPKCQRFFEAMHVAKSSQQEK